MPSIRLTDSWSPRILDCKHLVSGQASPAVVGIRLTEHRRTIGKACRCGSYLLPDAAVAGEAYSRRNELPQFLAGEDGLAGVQGVDALGFSIFSILDLPAEPTPTAAALGLSGIQTSKKICHVPRKLSLRFGQRG